MILWAIVGLIGLWLFNNFYWKRKGLPPGPTPLPILGNLPEFTKLGFEQCFQKYKNAYGDIHTVWFGESPMVMICDVPTINETFIKDGDTYAWRPVNQVVTHLRTEGKYGLIFNDGHMWKHHRRATLQVFRDFGMGKNIMQERVLDEARYLLQGVDEDLQKSRECRIQTKIDVAVGNIINVLLFGYRFDEGKMEEFSRLKVVLQNHLRAIGRPITRTLNFNPTLMKVCPKYILKEVRDSVSDMKEFFKRQIKQHEAEIDFNTDAEPTDFVEYYLKKKKAVEKEGDFDLYSEEQLFGACIDLWLAGQETTSNTIAWAVIYLMENFYAQEKLQQEFDKVIGSDRLITLDDRPQLNYLNAVVAETQRYCNLVPLNVPHRTIKDVVIHGYTIPANTTIIHHIGTVLKDERYFSEPEKFKPERFLDKNGKFFQPPELMPFGVGKRSCLGEGLARLELFLFIGNMFNQLEITRDPAHPPDMTRIVGGTVQPEPFVCNIKKRY